MECCNSALHQIFVLSTRLNDSPGSGNSSLKNAEGLLTILTIKRSKLHTCLCPRYQCGVTADGTRSTVQRELQ